MCLGGICTEVVLIPVLFHVWDEGVISVATGKALILCFERSS